MLLFLDFTDRGFFQVRTTKQSKNRTTGAPLLTFYLNLFRFLFAICTEDVFASEAARTLFTAIECGWFYSSGMIVLIQRMLVGT